MAFSETRSLKSVSKSYVKTFILYIEGIFLQIHSEITDIYVCIKNKNVFYKAELF